MLPKRNLLAWLVIAAISTGGDAQSSLPQGKLITISRADLCVTEGTLGQLDGKRFSVGVPKMRAYLDMPTPQFLETRFTYLGSTGHEAPLGSGEMRRQFGLKLRAANACNLVYVMWRIEPESKLVVSVKSNPGQDSSTECGNRGYTNIKARQSAAVPVVRPGETHNLRAEMNGQELRAFADGALVWEGSVGAAGMALDGPVGIRSDNARLEIALSVLRPATMRAAPCRSGPGESE
jgi:hypothetical protein